MDNNKIAVKTSLSVHVEEIKNLSRLIPNLVEDLRDSVTELSYCWQGPEWEEYQKTFAYYMEQLTEIYMYMDSYTTDIERTGYTNIGL